MQHDNYDDLGPPARPVVALLGHPDINGQITQFCERSTPGLTILCCDSAASLSQLQGAPPPLRTGSSTNGGGILKVGWLRKHQAGRPAVAAVLVPREKAAGDPSSWAQLATHLDAVKAAARTRATRVLVIVLQPLSAGPLPDDRVAMISKQAGVDRKSVATFSPDGGAAALQALVTLLREQAALYYAGDAQRRLSRYTSRNPTSVDANLRAAFKLGVLAERRGDWEVTARLYREAYSYVPQIGIAGAVPLQRFVEVRAVAELVHSRLFSLLLGQMRDPDAAVAQLDEHLRMLKRVPLEPVPPGLGGNHLGWVARQYTAAAAAIRSSGKNAAELPHSARPAQLYLAAALAAIERRRQAERLAERRGGAPAPAVGPVAPGLYVGRYVLPGSAALLSDLEFERYLEAKERATPHSQQALQLLQAARAAMPAAIAGQLGRSACQVGLLLGAELLGAGDAAAARAALQEVTAQYRRDRWAAPLWQALLLLRECAAREGDAAAHAALSLEAAALAGGGDEGQRSAMAAATLGTLQSPTDDGARFDYAVDSPQSPWLNVFELAAGFMRGSAGSGALGAPDEIANFALALRTSLPAPLVCATAEVTFEDDQGAFTLPLVPRSGGPDTAFSLSSGWQRFFTQVQPRCGGGLRATQATLRLGRTSSVTFKLPSLFENGRAKADAAPGARPFPAASGFQPGQLVAEVAPTNSHPILEMRLPTAALAGEQVVAQLRITAAVHTVAGGSVRLSAVDKATQQPVAVVAAGSRGTIDALVVPALDPGCTHSVDLVLAPQHAGTLLLQALLQFNATSPSDSSKDPVPEPGSVALAAALPVVLPLQLSLAVLGPPCTHSLLPDPGAEDATLAAGMSALSVHAAGAGLPRWYTLPAGQQCSALVTLRSAAPCGLDLIEVGWEMPAESPLHVTAAGGAGGEHDSLLVAGDSCARVFTLAASPAGVVPTLGQLRVRWRRQQRAAQALFTSLADPGAPPTLASQKEQDEGGSAAEEGGELVVPLPGTSFQTPLLTAVAAFPPEAAAGEVVSLELSLRSGSAAAEEVAVNVGEPHGFLVAGPRSGSVALPPGGAGRVSFALVPYHSGFLRLPQVRVSDVRGGAVVEVTKGCSVFVTPAVG